ncbi:MAG: hypothetical protein P3M73_00060 [Candidatus Hodgkinia cicadicola]|nr:MAG: hypothetical protein P3M73_00060 [Candidatus Hodgkinia cicadicola]
MTHKEVKAKLAQTSTRDLKTASHKLLAWNNIKRKQRAEDNTTRTHVYDFEDRGFVIWAMPFCECD